MYETSRGDNKKLNPNRQDFYLPYRSQNSFGDIIFVPPNSAIVKSFEFPVIIKSAFDSKANSSNRLSGESAIISILSLGKNFVAIPSIWEITNSALIKKSGYLLKFGQLITSKYSSTKSSEIQISNLFSSTQLKKIKFG